MRISDWSSDVCSSDLPTGHRDLDFAVIRLAKRDRLLVLQPVDGFRRRAHSVLEGRRWLRPVREQRVVLGEALLRRLDVVERLVLLKAHGDQLVHQRARGGAERRKSGEHTYELQSLMRI